MDAYLKASAHAAADPEGFWAAEAARFRWRKPWNRVLDWDFAGPEVAWFAEGQLNITENCLDRHLEHRGDALALVWEPNAPDGEPRKYTYRELHREVCRFAHMLHAEGVRTGDRVCLYLPMVPELAIAVLACARLGAVHSVVFCGFSSESLAARIRDAAAAWVITSDGQHRGPKSLSVKDTVDAALEHCPDVQRVFVLRNTGHPVHFRTGRDLWLHDALATTSDDFPAVAVGAEHPLFILYTSGSTGAPKGVVHTTAGYMIYAEYSFRWVFGARPDDIHWCTADLGWITGHTYGVYGPLLTGATTILFEGIPTFPDAGRCWEVIDRHAVSLFYTAPTAIRSLMAAGPAFLPRTELPSLRVIGSVGEPINEAAWTWYKVNIGRGRCPLVDTWWQTETGGILISACAGLTPEKPAHAGLPLPGVFPVLVDPDGREIAETEAEGLLCLKFPWPGMLRTTWGDHARCRATYFERFPGLYFTGDGARRDADGMYRIVGRVDDVLNVSGHRLGTAELENAINRAAGVVESAVVGVPHALKGTGIVAFVVTEGEVPEAGSSAAQALQTAVASAITSAIGPIARPDQIIPVSGLPKTRSGKIMRRILRALAEGRETGFGDVSTLLDPVVVEEIRGRMGGGGGRERG